MFDFQHAALGGTFDHFHSGHKRILDYAFHTAQYVTIGIVGEAPIAVKLFSNMHESFHIRKDAVTSYIRQNEWEKKSTITKLTDIYGPAADDSTFDVIVVTRETAPNAEKINKKRLQNNLKPLSIVTVPLMKGADNNVIRSTRIREGVINRDGDPYFSLFTKTKQLILPPRLRTLLRKPLGQIIEGEERFTSFIAQKAVKIIKRHKPTLLIAVGDIVSQSFIKVGCIPDVCIKDYRSRRKELSYKSLIKENHILNPPGSVRQEAVKEMKKAIDRSITSKIPQTVVIKGEEDLLALPAIMLAPLGSIVVYGQWDFGIVIVQITENMKQKVAGIVRQFES